ncbi:MAG TPA: N-acetylmuramoyl-L-alanine amidase [Chloroflexi bacterium]|nr:N-acetylmuramoyl-L-alanine amidase [Chloroflexota bacterium]
MSDSRPPTPNPKPRFRRWVPWLRYPVLEAAWRGARGLALAAGLLALLLGLYGLLVPTPAASQPGGPSSGRATLPPPTPTPPPPTPSVPRIGIVAGHWWPEGSEMSDAGAVCPDGLTEVEINKDVAERVVFTLRKMGYRADLLAEWDERLQGYQADALVSIHADSCLYPEASGFKVARVTDSVIPEEEDRLVACLADRYARRTGLRFHRNSITYDMTRYHTFYEIDPLTPGAIIEVGFMLADRDLLTRRPDLVAQGIIDGLLCYLREETVNGP